MSNLLMFFFFFLPFLFFWMSGGSWSQGGVITICSECLAPHVVACDSATGVPTSCSAAYSLQWNATAGMKTCTGCPSLYSSPFSPSFRTLKILIFIFVSFLLDCQVDRGIKGELPSARIALVLMLRRVIPPLAVPHLALLVTT